jgi:hypothetical protein
MPNQILGQPGQGNAGELDDFEFASGPFVAQWYQGDLHRHRMAQRARKPGSLLGETSVTETMGKKPAITPRMPM